MQNSFKVSCIQNNSGESISENIETAAELTLNAKSAGADLICLPEYFCYLDNDDARMLKHSFTQEQHPALSKFCSLAVELDVWILIGSLPIKISDEKVNNRSFLINQQGEVASYYNKLHLFDVKLSDTEFYSESATVEAGDKLVLATTPWGLLGMSICYDLRFAYLYRQLAQRGASFISIPAAFTKTTGQAHWHTLVRARAIETGCYVFAPCQCGEHPGGRITYGHSLIVDPWGKILANGGDSPGIIYADIDIQNVQQARSKIPALTHDRVI